MLDILIRRTDSDYYEWWLRRDERAIAKSPCAFNRYKYAVENARAFLNAFNGGQRYVAIIGEEGLE